MTSDLLLGDLFVWSLQIAALTALSALFSAIARLRAPHARLLYWQSVLVAGLALPLIRPLQRPVADVTIATASVVPVISPQAHHGAIFPLSEIVLGALLMGAAIRLALIGLGLIRLRKYRLNSRPLDPGSTWDVEAQLRVSDDVTGPVTFGLRRPVVLLPVDFAEMDESSRDAVLCHEILHVRRKDWLFTLAEEIVRAAFWFHPAVWWTLGEIQLAREQTVDRGVIETTRLRDRYVDALLAIAGTRGGMDVPMAPLFLRKRHLKQRVVMILKEVQMSRKRTLSTLAAGFVLLGGFCWFVTGALPLEGAPQTVADAPGVSMELSGAQLMHRSSVSYPREAMAKGVEGTVIAQVTIDAGGNVADAAILSGPDELRKAVLQSVLEWHFGKTAAQSTRQVAVRFELPKGQSVTVSGAISSVPSVPVRAARIGGEFPPSVLIKTIQVNGLSDDAAAELLRSLPVHEGETVSSDQLSAVSGAARAFDEHLIVSTAVSPSQKEVALTIFPGTTMVRFPTPPPPPDATATPAGPGQIRVEPQAQAGNLVSQPKPVYPPLAKVARVQGTVRFEATIGKDGSVGNLRLLAGPPLLVQAAMQAAQQWKYKPTLLNGQPVEVLTTIDINFTLSE